MGIAELQETSGLSEAQLADLFGVSPVTLRMWRRGGVMADHHVEMLSAVQMLVERVDASSPARCALMLTQRGRDGRSLLQDMCARWSAVPV
jgi:hypothetical protein